MSEKVKMWEPVKGIGGKYWLECVIDDRNFIKRGNCIKITRYIKFRLRKNEEEHKTIELTFADIASYTITNESYSGPAIDLVDSEKELKKSKGVWIFYTMEDSASIELIEQQTGIPASVYNFRHYHIIAIDDVIDVITNVEPRVEVFLDDILVETNAI